MKPKRATRKKFRKLVPEKKIATKEDGDIGLFEICEPVPSLAELTNHELARLLMRVLYQGYDAGGISVGRSYQSEILEEVMDLIPVQDLRRRPVYGDVTPGWSRVRSHLDELIAEAKGRSPSVGHKQLLLFPVEMGVYHSSTLAVGLLYHLEKYCEEHPEQGTWSIVDREIIRALKKLVTSDEVCDLTCLPLENLLQSFRDRRYLAWRQSSEVTALDF